MYWAIHVKKVHIISMSFGFSAPVEEIEYMINQAYDHGVLIIAAASNVGGNGEVSWPARHEHVICISATDGRGNSYDENPTPTDDSMNLATLGMCVKALWLPSPTGEHVWKYKTGTSTATPIACSLAASVMVFLRRAKPRYIEIFPRRDDAHRAAEEKRYDRKVKALGRPAVMRKVLALMVKHGKRRGSVKYLAPWTFFDFPRHGTIPETLVLSLVVKILTAIDA